jgi:hypothetical protein
MTRGVSLIPDRYMCKLKYSESYAFPGVASLETFELRGNSINDPNLTGTGHQPLGHTELASLYNKYRVLGSSCKIILTPTGTGQGSILKYCLSPRTESGVPTSWSVQVEQPYTKRLGFTSLITGGGNVSRKALSMYMPTAKILGITKVKASDDDYSAAFAANPDKQWYWQITVSSSDESTAIECRADILMTYYVVCYERKELASS